LLNGPGLSKTNRQTGRLFFRQNILVQTMGGIQMRRTVFCFVVVCLSMALSAPAWATWSKFTAAGSGLGIGTPSCAQLATNKVACAVLSGTDTMMVNVFNGKWGKWTSITGTVSSVPSCTSDGDGNVFCAATTGAGLEVATYNGSKWSAPVAVSGTLYSAPSCAKSCAWRETRAGGFRGLASMGRRGARLLR
jgi:hypothetical protein